MVDKNNEMPIKGYALQTPSKNDIVLNGLYVNRKYLPDSYRELYENGDPITFSRGIKAAKLLESGNMSYNRDDLDYTKWRDYVTNLRNGKTYFDPRYNGLYGRKDNGEIMRVDSSTPPSDLVGFTRYSIVRNNNPEFEPNDTELARGNFHPNGDENPVPYYGVDINNRIVQSEAQKKGLNLTQETADRITANRILDGFIKTLKGYGIRDRDLEDIGIKGGYNGIDKNTFDYLNQRSRDSDFWTNDIYKVYRSFLGGTENFPMKDREMLLDELENGMKRVGSFVRDHSSDSPYLFVTPDSNGNMNLTNLNTYANGGYLSTRKDNFFPQSHRFADGGNLYMRKNNLSTPTLKSADGVTMGKPMRLEELQKLREDWEQNAQSSDETNAQSSDSATTPPSDKTTTQLPDNLDGLSDDDIDNLALQTLRSVYGNGKKRKEALGDSYAAVQKRVNEMLKEMQAAKEAKKAAKEAARNRKAWDETPEEYKQQLTPKKYNPRSYDLTTDDLRLHERAARQAQQERSLDDNPHSRIRDNGETKKLIGGTNNYDIYL